MLNKKNYLKVKEELVKWYRAGPVKAGIVLFLLAVIIVSGAIAFLIMVFPIFPSTQEGLDTKNRWLDINFQILNTIFTLGALVDQPMRLTGLVVGLSLCWHHRRWSKMSSKTCQSACASEKGRDGQYIERERDKCRRDLKRLTRYFPWFTVEAELMLPPTVAKELLADDDSTVTQTVIQSSPETSSDNNSSQNTPNQSQPELAPVVMPVTNLRHFMYAMFSLTVSTLGQAVMSYIMWWYNPIQIRPQLPFAIALPISFATNFAGMIWTGIQANKLKTYNESLNIAPLALNVHQDEIVLIDE